MCVAWRERDADHIVVLPSYPGPFIFKLQASLGAEAEKGAWISIERGPCASSRGGGLGECATNKGCKLMQISWKRIILDEAHKLSRAASSLHPTLAKVQAHHR